MPSYLKIVVEWTPGGWNPHQDEMWTYNETAGGEIHIYINQVSRDGTRTAEH
ncbi:hypothetical protein [Thermococcus sp. JCM 11816]|uniref:hypothetical protein n=1 Tax=Thermococcus sp. (strain JCM 11816 / KS-1) TaxID=1295125 RepID=UPI0034671098